MLEAKTRIWKVGGTIVITIPTGLVNDSNFPYNIKYNDKNNESMEPISVKMKIDDKRLIIEKTKEVSKQ